MDSILKLKNSDLNFIVDRHGMVSQFNTGMHGRSLGARVEDTKAMIASRREVWKRVTSLHNQKKGFKRILQLLDILKGNDLYRWDEIYVNQRKVIRVYEYALGAPEICRI